MLYDALIQQGHRDMVATCFGLDIHESVRCRHCDMETHALRYTQYFQVRRLSCTGSLSLPYHAVMCHTVQLRPVTWVEQQQRYVLCSTPAALGMASPTLLCTLVWRRPHLICMWLRIICSKCRRRRCGRWRSRTPTTRWATTWWPSTSRPGRRATRTWVSG